MADSVGNLIDMSAASVPKRKPYPSDLDYSQYV